MRRVVLIRAALLFDCLNIQYMHTNSKLFWNFNAKCFFLLLSDHENLAAGYSLSQCIKSADLLTPAYRDYLENTSEKHLDPGLSFGKIQKFAHSVWYAGCWLLWLVTAVDRQKFHTYTGWLPLTVWFEWLTEESKEYHRKICYGLNKGKNMNFF